MKINSILFFLIVMATLFSCNKKDDFNYPNGKVGISTIVYFPIIAINGDRIMSIVQGGTFTDPGANAVLQNKPETYTTTYQVGGSATASLDVNTPGVYTVTYTAANSEGYTASDWRMVVVAPSGLGADPVVSKNDFSGTYLRAATGVTSTWTKLEMGVYKVENPGGASSGAGKYVVAVNYSGFDIKIPTQNDLDFGGVVSSSDVTYMPGPPATYTWIFYATGYGTGNRTFVKQ